MKTAQKEGGIMKKRKMKRKMTFAACMIAAALLAGCGGSSSSTSYQKMDMAVAETMAETMAETTAATASRRPENGLADGGGFEGKYEETSQAQTLQNPDGIDTRKLIKNVDLSVETKQFDQFLAMIQNKVSALGGYVEQSNIRGNSYRETSSRRSANLTIRIPIAQIDAFVNGVSEECNVLNKSEYVQDVTLQYTDLESRKKALKVEQERLMELLAKAESMDAIIAIEERMSDIRYELESYEAQLRLMDNQVSYSTVELYVSEAEVFTPVVEDGFWTQIQKGFGRNMGRVVGGVRSFVIWFLSSLPVLVFWGLIIAGIIFVVVRILKKNEEYHKQKDEGRKKAFLKEKKAAKAKGEKAKAAEAVTAKAAETDAATEAKKLDFEKETAETDADKTE